MPKMTIEQAHVLEPSIVRKNLEGLQVRLAEKYGLTVSWTSNTEATIKRSGVSGTIRCEPQKVLINLDLSFALTPLKGTIEQRIRQELTQALT